MSFDNITLFGKDGLKMSQKFVSALAHMCNPDKPMDRTALFEDFAITEICVSNTESIEIKASIEALRTDAQKEFVSQLLDGLQAQSKAARNPAIADMTASMEMEYKRLCKVFFIRCRCYEVIRNSTNVVLGRFVVFPDQIADDYGFNLDEHSEESMNQVKVSRSQRFASHVGTTVYVGHGVGSAMAQLCGFLKDEPSIIFDGSVLSDVVVRHAVNNKMPKGSRIAKRKEGEREWNLLHYYFSAGASQWEAVCPKVLEVEAKVVKAEEEAAAENKADRNSRRGFVSKDQQKESKDLEEQLENASKYFSKRIMFAAGGVVSPATAARAAGRTGRFSAPMLSDLYADYMTIFRQAPYVYAPQA